MVEVLLAKVKLSELASSLGLFVTNKGGTAKSICPFHDDTTPSMVLYDQVSAGDRPHFHCYACGAHGDIFHLAQEKLGKSFPEVLSWLAQQNGIPLPTKGVAESKKAREISPDGVRQDGFRSAISLFEKQPGSQQGISELAQSREYDPAFLEHAGLVVSSPDVLKKTAVGAGGNRRLLADLEAAGLLKARRDTRPETQSYHLDLGLWQEFFYERRAIFPLRQLNGNLVGLAGRLLNSTTNKQSPKYLYTPGFKRSEILYRADSAFQKIVDEAGKQKKEKSRTKKQDLHLYVVEGLFDALRLESMGFRAVSILGSEISPLQADAIKDLSQRLDEDYGATLFCHVFLDKDEAGIRGSAKALRFLLARNVEVDYIYVSDRPGKDPDEILKHLPKDTDFKFTCYPPALAMLADTLGVAPEEILRFKGWDDVSPQRLGASAQRIVRDVASRIPGINDQARIDLALDQISRCCGEGIKDDVWWLRNFRSLALPRSALGPKIPGLFLEDQRARLNSARQLAWSSVQRGELPVDELSWNRIDRVALLFNRDLITCLKEREGRPLEPFDSVHVPRGFDQIEPRTKAMPIPEDLILQQYVLAELLSERMGLGFSEAIPAVRYFHDRKQTVTTGENGPGVQHETLSFAYQIDMEVLEGRLPPKESGIFRHYWECWQDFIKSLRRNTANFDGEVYSVRLDLKRYYDNVKRGWLRDILVNATRKAFQGLEERNPLSFLAKDEATPEELAESTVEWLLKQSFGYEYYEPSKGDVVTAKPDVGLPQGPDLSAYLATVAMFPIDREMRHVLGRINAERLSPRAVYARYVDDIVLAADSELILKELRHALEDALRGSNLEAVNKHGPIPPMPPGEFAAFLTNHRAFTASMPAPGFCLSPDGDGAAFVDGGLPEDRSDALIVLNDPRLYFASKDSVVHGISAALSIHGELRHNEVVKAIQWLWYMLADHDLESLELARSEFFRLWRETIGAANLWSSLSKELPPCSDPAAYAIEGLDRLLSLSNQILKQSRFVEAERQSIAKRLHRLATLAAEPTLNQFFENTGFEDASPVGWGIGLSTQLRRMFLQRLTAIRGRASILLGNGSLSGWDSSSLFGDVSSKSLRRSYISIIECSGQDTLPAARRYLDTADWSDVFALAHEAVARLRVANAETDPLRSLQNLLHGATEQWGPSSEQIVHTLRLWFERNDQFGDTGTVQLAANEVEQEFALRTFIAATPRSILPTLLSRRTHLLKAPNGAAEAVEPLPPFPVQSDESERVVVFFTNKSGELWALTHDTNNPPTKLALECEWKKLFDHAGLGYWKAEIEAIEISRPCNISPYEASSTTVRDLGAAARSLIKQALVISRLDATDEAVLERPISAAHIYRRYNPDKTSEWGIVSIPVSSSLLGNQAFLWKGKAGLRSLAVPLEDAWLWRIGTALTDFFGFGDDLVHFSALPHPPTDEGHTKTEPPMAWYLMREALFRLRGGLATSKPGHSSEMTRVPAGIERLIQQLERFPNSADETHSSESQLAFLLSTMAETEAMRLRLSCSHEFDQPGIAANFCHELASNLLRNKFKVAWAEHLPLSDAPFMSKARRPVATLLELHSRILKLPVPITGCEGDLLAWQTFVLGSDLAVGILAIRIAVIDLTVLNNGVAGFRDDRFDWTCKAYLARNKNVFGKTLLEVFSEGVNVSGAHGVLEEVTPLGWVSLLRGVFISLSERMAAAWAHSLSINKDGIIKKIDHLLDQLTPELDVGTDDSIWPFDCGLNAWIAQKAKCIEDNKAFAQAALELVAELDEVFQLRLETRQEGQFPYRGDRFDGSHHLPGWRHINWFGERRRESVREGDRYYYPWTEVWCHGQLISVLTTSERLAKLAGVVPAEIKKATLGTNAVSEGSSNLARLPKPIDQVILEQSTAIPNDQRERPLHDVVPQEHSLTGGENKENVESSGSTSVEPEVTPEPDGEPPQLPAGPDTVVPPDVDEPLAASTVLPEEYVTAISGGRFDPPFKRRQRKAWSERAQKCNSRHIRVALLQWDVEDTYRHPLVDAGVHKNIWEAVAGTRKIKDEFSPFECKRGGEHEIDLKVVEAVARPSWSEHRRRRLLLEALEACEKFKTDVLVLPEYSVRPETVIWLRDYVSKNASAPAIYAGTYRMFGSAERGADIEKLGLFGSKHTDLQAVLSLIERPKGKNAVVYTRPKRYPSVAADECFNPGCSSDTLFLQRNGPDKGVDPLSFFVELICAEIFVATSPANLHFLVEEYQCLLRKFHGKVSGIDPKEIVMQDILDFAGKTGLSSPSDVWPRKTILVVPAMTSRSADYWIFGQSALLASGMTTVFCNAVAGKYGVGGSCFVGRNSWFLKGNDVAMMAQTPYHGWSHGIYYSNEKDPLTTTEQAMVIADIHPEHMMEGKPRPQSLSNPLQLVAYLPIIESLNYQSINNSSNGLPNKRTDVSEVTQGIDRILGELKDVGSILLNPNTKGTQSKSLAEHLDELAKFFDDNQPVKQRTKAWRNDFKQQPQVGMHPPALVDWLWVDLTPEFQNDEPYLPKILVPPWTTDHSVTEE